MILKMTNLFSLMSSGGYFLTIQFCLWIHTLPPILGIMQYFFVLIHRHIQVLLVVLDILDRLNAHIGWFSTKFAVLCRHVKMLWSCDGRSSKEMQAS